MDKIIMKKYKLKKNSKIISLDLNKYKIETDIISKYEEVDNIIMNKDKEQIINNGVNSINELINKENNNINSNFKKQKEEIDELKNNLESDKLENININEEINNKENNENNLNTEESKRLDNSESDLISINSNSSAKKSNKSTSKKIRGFNFRNKINMKKYKGNKSERSSSPTNSNGEK